MDRDELLCPIEAAAGVDEIEQPIEGRAAEHAGHRPEDQHTAHHDESARDQRVLLSAASAELIAIAPRCHFRPLRLTDANELEPFLQAREADLVSRNAQLRAAKRALGFLDAFPTLL